MSPHEIMMRAIHLRALQRSTMIAPNLKQNIADEENSRAGTEYIDR